MMHTEHLSDYERAVYYHTLPKVIIKIHLGVIGLFALALGLAGIATIYGLLNSNSKWTQPGLIGLAVLIVGGIIAFLYVALKNRVQMEKAQASAKGIPDADSQFDDIPDPFVDHIILSKPVHSESSFSLFDNKGVEKYTVEVNSKDHSLTLEHIENHTIWTVNTIRQLLSFSFNPNAPSRISVLESGNELAWASLQFNFGAPKTMIRMQNGNKLDVIENAIYHENELVGRIYEVRKRTYLDINKEYIGPGILGFFIAMY
jgi:hypothetical protein